MTCIPTWLALDPCPLGLLLTQQAEQKALEERHGSGFKIIMSRQDAWRLRFEIVPFTAGPDGFTRWDEDNIPTWIRSVAFENSAPPEPFNLHPDGGQFDFARPSARTPHEAYV